MAASWTKNAFRLSQAQLAYLAGAFGPRCTPNAPLSRLTAARAGGNADALITVDTAGELAETVTFLWEMGLPFMVLGGGSNLLVSDLGVREVVVLNRSKAYDFQVEGEQIRLWAESGVNFGSLARQAALRGYSGLEWAAGIPGTVGGAVAGNAGAHGSDTAACVRVAEILHHLERIAPSQAGPNESELTRREMWTVEELGFTYRSSRIKLDPQAHVVLSAEFGLQAGDSELIQAKMEEYQAFRRRTQPPGASMGSMFKNPAGDYAGRLIEAAGLKGQRVGNAQISPLHANFFVNLGEAKAGDIYALICRARQEVLAKTGTRLELEIILAGEWPNKEGCLD